MRDLDIPLEVLNGKDAYDGYRARQQGNGDCRNEPVELNISWGSDRVTTNRNRSDLALKRYISQVTQHDERVANLAGLLAQERVSSWGQTTPVSDMHGKMNESIMEGLGVTNACRSDELRPVILLNIWKPSPASSVSLFFLVPIPVTSMNDVGSFDSSVIREAERLVYVEDPSSTRTDRCKRVRSHGRLKLTGRLAMSVVSEAINISRDRHMSYEEMEPISVHLGSARIMYFVVVGHRTALCTLTLRSLEMISRMSRHRTDIMFDEFMSVTIYADMGDARTRDTSNSCIRMTIDGSVRYLGKPVAIKRAFSKLRELLELPFASSSATVHFVSTLTAVVE